MKLTDIEDKLVDSMEYFLDFECPSWFSFPTTVIIRGLLLLIFLAYMIILTPLFFVFIILAFPITLVLDIVTWVRKKNLSK